MSRGSSPLARGLPRLDTAPHGETRIIPARAGFTHVAPVAQGGHVDHPRSRGVYPRVASAMSPWSGSSPLARGLPHRRWPGGGGRGIIPARAGFTSTTPREVRSARDHPRSRGVYLLTSRSTPICPGSSPLARGLRSRRLLDRGRQRIIPARAGFTRGAAPPTGGRPDHPRSRGVYPPLVFEPVRHQGSSPLARGLRLGAPHRGRRARIIPARAGFTPATPLSRDSPLDHPRSRGVYLGEEVPFTTASGSSPLARGLPPRRPRPAQERGIIPARAGFTAAVAGHGAAPTDHPRSRGVYSARGVVLDGEDGSSPLARGLLAELPGRTIVRRIIPARAGFTGPFRYRVVPGRDHPRSRGVYQLGM